MFIVTVTGSEVGWLPADVCCLEGVGNAITHALSTVERTNERALFAGQYNNDNSNNNNDTNNNNNNKEDIIVYNSNRDDPPRPLPANVGDKRM